MTAIDATAVEALTTAAKDPDSMSPPSAAVGAKSLSGDKARRIIDAMAQAAREGRGAVSLDGRLIDIASIRMAQALITKADAITVATNSDNG